MHHPSLYTTHQGGKWLPWLNGKVEDWQLEQLRDPHFVLINNLHVHAFMFDVFGEQKRWDCLNGWTK